MEIGMSGGIDGEMAVDGSAGSVVWVRRRNGSWWPGRILAPEELSATYLLCPRSGTPVKLLGRDDASVDWYNLEKSKRVKPFRCGEFDSCIERATTSQGIPIKKREKYARREDAILHALELEKQQSDLKQNKLGNISSGISNRTFGAPNGAHKQEPDDFPSEVYIKNDERGHHSKFVTHKSQEDSAKTVLFYEGNSSNYVHVHKGSSNEFGCKEGIPDTVPRKRVSKNFVLQNAPLKGVLSQSVSDNHVNDLSSDDHILGGGCYAGSSKKSSSKKKSSQGVVGKESLKKRNRRRPLVQVLRSSENLPVSHSFHSDYEDDVFPMQDQDHMSPVRRAKRSRCVYLPANSNISMDHSGYDSEETAVTETQFGLDDHFLPIPSLSDRCSSSESLEETESDSSGRVFWKADIEEGNFRRGGAGVDSMVGISEWHMKGKRNRHNMARGPFDNLEDAPFNRTDRSNDSAKVTSFRSKGSSFISSSQKTAGPSFHNSKELNEDLSHTRLTRYDDQKYHFSFMGSIHSDDESELVSHSGWHSDDESDLISRPGWEAGGASHVAQRAYWGDSGEWFEMGPDLFDVDLKVKVSYQGEHVPLVSLMSRLDGRAIIGHPVQVEIMEDGSTGQLVSRNEPTAMWKTARRTTMQRVPRLFKGEDLEYLDQESKPQFSKLYSESGNVDHHAKFAKKDSSHSLRAVSLNRKTITLSSMSTNRKIGGEDIGTRLIRAEGQVPPVTCIPVKVVFSRILETIGRPSAAFAHRVLAP